ncbi:MAG: hypothetical protein QOI82_1242 [Actinomycetota bacterium]|jgi:AcrR family transcriptional regulator|nr:hypothetical protein [Actinomycetota bacterium]
MVTSKAVKRKPYSSSLRTAQAQATRRGIVDAAARLFVESGYGGTSVEAIAAAAGVSRKTVFTSVGGKFEALKLAIDWAIVGDDEPIPLLERPDVQAMHAEPDARRILSHFATTVSEANARLADLAAVLDAAAGLDADLRGLAQSLTDQRLAGMRVLAGLLDARGALRAGLSRSEAADVLWLLGHPAGFHRMVRERSWSVTRHREWLAETLTAALIAPSYRPVRGRGRGSRPPS